MIGACDWWSCMASYFFTLGVAGTLSLLILLSLLLTVFHEAGHYYAAKLCGIDSKEFALGRGPTILRVRATPSGCKFALRMFPAGGMVTYDDRYCELGYAKRAFMSSAGWMMDVVVATVVITVVVLLGVTGPLITFLCTLVGMRAVCNLLPITDDGRKTIRYLWLAATERTHHAQFPGKSDA